MSGEIQRQWVLLACDSENFVVAGQVDLDHDMPGRHFLQELVGIIFIHDVHSMTDALRVTYFDRFANVTLEAFGRDHAKCEFAGMKTEMDLGIDGMQVLEHRHLPVILSHRKHTVLGLSDIDAQYAWVGTGHLEVEEHLREGSLRRGFAWYGEQVAHNHVASHGGLRGIAMFAPIA